MQNTNPILENLVAESAKQFEERFVKMTEPSTIGSGRDEMVEPMKILNVRKPDKILAFLSAQISSAFALGRQSVIDEIDHEGKKLIDGFSHPNNCKMCKKL